jgi:hypothetical protein
MGSILRAVLWRLQVAGRRTLSARPRLSQAYTVVLIYAKWNIMSSIVNPLHVPLNHLYGAHASVCILTFKDTLASLDMSYYYFLCHCPLNSKVDQDGKRSYDITDSKCSGLNWTCAHAINLGSTRTWRWLDRMLQSGSPKKVPKSIKSESLQLVC